MALLFIGDAVEKAVYSLELDGSSPTQLFNGLAKSINNPLYIESLNKFTFMETDLYGVDYDGSNLTILVNPTTPLGSGHTVGIDLVNLQLWYAINGDNEIHKVDYDGSNDALVFSTTDPRGIVIDVGGGKVYWHSEKAIHRADFPTGANSEDLVTGVGRINQVAVDLVNGKMYWVDNIGDAISWANLDGTSKAVIISTVDPKTGSIAVDGTGGNLYHILDAAHTLRMSDLDGGNNVQIWAGSTFPAAMSITPPAASAAAPTTFTRCDPNVYPQGPGRTFIQRHAR